MKGRTVALLKRTEDFCSCCAVFDASLGLDKDSRIGLKLSIKRRRDKIVNIFMFCKSVMDIGCPCSIEAWIETWDVFESVLHSRSANTRAKRIGNVTKVVGGTFNL